MIQIFRFLFSGKVAIWLLCLMALILPLTIPGQFGVPLFKPFMLDKGILSLPFLVLFGLLVLNQIGAAFIRLSWYLGKTTPPEPEDIATVSTMEAELEEGNQQIPPHNPPQPPSELVQYKDTIQTILPVNNARAVIETLGFRVTDTAQFLDNKEEIEAKKGTSRTLSTFLLHVGVVVLLTGMVFAFVVHPTRQVKLLQEQPSMLGGLERTPWKETLKRIGLVAQDSTDYPKLPIVLAQIHTLQTKVRMLQQPQKHLTRWENSLSRLFFKPTSLDIQTWSIPAVYHTTSYLKLGPSQKLVEISQKANVSHGPYILSFGGTYAEASVTIAGQHLQLKQSEIHPLPLGGTLELLGYLPQHGNLQTGCLLLRYVEPKQTSWSACVPHNTQTKIANKIDFLSNKMVLGIVLNYSNRFATNLIIIGLILFLLGFIGFWWIKRYRIFMIWRRDNNEINIEASGYGIKAKSMLKGIKESLFFPIENITGPSRPQGGPSSKGNDGSKGLGQNVSSLAKSTASSALLTNAGSSTAISQNKPTHPGKADAPTASSMTSAGNVTLMEGKITTVNQDITSQTPATSQKPSTHLSSIIPSVQTSPTSPQPQVISPNVPSGTSAQTTSAQKNPVQPLDTSSSKLQTTSSLAAQGQLAVDNRTIPTSTTGIPIAPANSAGSLPASATPQKITPPATPQKSSHLPVEPVSVTPPQTTSVATSNNPFIPASTTPPLSAIKDNKASVMLPKREQTTTETSLPAAQTPPKQSLDLANEDSAQMTIQTQSRWRQTDSFDKETILQAAKQRPKGLAALDASTNSTNQTNSQPTINRVKPESLLEPSEQKPKPTVAQPQTPFPTTSKNTPSPMMTQNASSTLTNTNPQTPPKPSSNPSEQLPSTKLASPSQTQSPNTAAQTTSTSSPAPSPTIRPPQSTLAPQLVLNGDKKETQPSVPPTTPKQNTTVTHPQPPPSSVSTQKPLVTSSAVPVPTSVASTIPLSGEKASGKPGGEVGLNLDSLFAGMGGEKASNKGTNENFFDNLDIDSLFEKVEDSSAEKTSVSARPAPPIDDAKTSVSTPRPNLPKKS